MSKQITRRPKKVDRRQERREEQLRREAEQKRAARRQRFTLIGIIVAAVVLVGTIVAYAIYSSGQPQTEPIVNPAYQPVGGIYCDQQEQTAFHIHAHLSIFINGQPAPLSQGIGIASDSSCFYWLHTHDTTGVIHIESPAGHSFVLGNFLDEWSSTQFSSLNYPSQLDLSGWTAYLNGKLYQGNYRNIPLLSHNLITIMYNSPNAKPDTFYNWDAAGLAQ